MNSDSVGPGDSVSVVDQLEEERKARAVWGLYRGVWPFVTLTAIGLSVIATGVAHFFPLYLPRFFYSTGQEIWLNHASFGLLGSIFLHGGFFHLFFNLYWLWLLGRVLEVEIGRLGYSLLIVASAWITGVAELAASGDPGIGISGVLYTLFGYMWVNRKRVPGFARVLPSKVVNLFIVWLFVCIGLTYGGLLNVANAAHFAGFVFGCGAGLVGQQSIRRLFAVSVVLVTAFSFPLAWAPWQEGWLVAKAYRQLTTKDNAGDTDYLDRVLLKNPKNVWANFTKGRLYLEKKQYPLAKEKMLLAADMGRDKADIANGVAWLLSTCPDETVREGKRALSYAKRACELTDWKFGAYVDTYAAALAETNDFQSALTWAEKAAVLAPDQKAIIEKHAEAFKAGRAWRE